METKDFIIYKGIANAAARVFENVICPAGEYTAKDIAKNLLSKYYYKDEYYKNSVQENEIITVEFDGYKCTFPVGSAFDVCAQIETAWQIPSARRVKFIRAAETRPVAVRFDVPAAAKEIIKAIPAKFDNLRPVMNYVCIDTRRRALIAGAANVLTAVAVPNMFISEDAKETYLIDPCLFKTGKGTISVDEENAVNGTQTRPVAERERRFPSWENILPAVQDAQKITLSVAAWKQLKKEITAAAKFSDNAQNLVQISGVAGADSVEITYFRIFETNETGNSTRRVSVAVPQPCPFSFSVMINGKQFAAVPAADSMYIFRNGKTGNTAVCFSAPGVAAYLPNMDEDRDVNTANVPAAAEDEENAAGLLSVAAFPELHAANTPAALASVQDAPAAAAEDAKETRPSWEQTLPVAAVSFAFDEETPAAEDAPAVAADSENVLPVDEETAAAAFEDAQPVAVSADSWETEYAVAAVESNARAVDAQAVPVLPAGMDEKLYLNICCYLKIYFDEETAYTRAAYNYIILHGVKILFGEIYLHDNKIGSVKKEFENGVCVSAVPVFDVQETAAPVAEDAPAVQDEETPAADSVPAVAANDIETLLNKQFETYLAAVAVEQHEKETNAVDAVAVEITADEETAPAVQDEETPAVAEDAPAVAVSLPAVITPADNLRWAFENGLITEKEYICTVWNVAVYDENGFDITAPAAPADMKNNFAPVAADSLHAVYIDGVLHGVYFSKLLADAVLFDAFFAGRSVYPLQLSANETAPETERAAVAVAAEDAQETAPAVQDEETPAADSVPAAAVAADSETPAVQDEETPAAVFASVWACMPEIWETAAPVADSETPAVAVSAPQDEETPAVLIGCPSRSGNARRGRSRRFAPWLIRAAAVFAVLLLSVFASWERETPAVAVPAVFAAPADSVLVVPAAAVQDEETAAPAADSETAPAVQETPAVAAAVPVADKQPQRMKKRPQTAKETAPAVQDAPAVPADSVLAVAADSVPADSVKQFAAVAVADSVPADSVYFAADSVLAVPADSVPAVDEETPQTAKETAPAVAAEDAPAVQDEETPAADNETPAVADSETPQDEETPAADSVPAAAGNVPGCPAVPAVQCAPAAPLAPVTPIVIACFGN